MHPSSGYTRAPVAIKAGSKSALGACCLEYAYRDPSPPTQASHEARRAPTSSPRAPGRLGPHPCRHGAPGGRAADDVNANPTPRVDAGAGSGGLGSRTFRPRGTHLLMVRAGRALATTGRGAILVRAGRALASSLRNLSYPTSSTEFADRTLEVADTDACRCLNRSRRWEWGQ